MAHIVLQKLKSEFAVFNLSARVAQLRLVACNVDIEHQHAQDEYEANGHCHHQLDQGQAPAGPAMGPKACGLYVRQKW